MTAEQSEVATEIFAFAVGFTAFFAIGLAGGIFAAGYLRRRGLRWTWALLGLPLAYLLWDLQPQVGLACMIATLTALRLGACVRAEMLRRGGEEAQRERDATGPLLWASARLANRRARQDRLGEEGLAIGTDRRGDVCRVPFSFARGVHALLLGATGSGKTVSAAAIAQAHVLSDQPVIVLDPKGDPDLRAVLAEAAEVSGADFHAWSPTGSTIYNPLARGGVTEIADKALASHNWSEPHYELATQRLLGQALATMRAADDLWPPTLSGLVTYMDPERLDALGAEVGGESAERVSSYVDGLSARAKADLGGGRDRLAVLAESEFGPRLDPTLGDGEAIDLDEVFRYADVLYVHLDSDRYPAASKLLAAALISDLVGLTADLQAQGGGYGGLLVIDEFAALAADGVSRLFARARSAGLSLLLGTQSLADLRGARPGEPSDTLTEQLLSNVEYLLAHRIGDPDSAERLARLAGTVPAWSVTERIAGNGTMLATGEGTRTREREFVVVPDQFKRLRTGEAVVIDPAAGRGAEIVRVWPPC